MLSPHDLRASSHWEYAVLVRNTWVLWCLKEMGTNRYKIIRVNIYNWKIFFNSKEGYFQVPPPPSPILRTIYRIKDAPKKKTTHRDTENNRTEDTDMWINIENNQINPPHVKEEIPKRTDLLKAGAYCTAASCRLLPVNHFNPSRSMSLIPLNEFSPTHCVWYWSHYSLPFTAFAIFTNWFAALTK